MSVVSEMLNLPPDAQATNISSLLQYTREYLQTPSIVWKNADLTTQTKLQWFEFPSGLIYDNGKLQTREVTNKIRMNELFQECLYATVDPSRFELLTSGVQNRRSTK